MIMVREQKQMEEETFSQFLTFKAVEIHFIAVKYSFDTFLFIINAIKHLTINIEYFNLS